MQFQFSLPSSVAFAPGSSKTVGHLVLGLDVKKVLAIYDSGVKSAGIADAIASSLKAASLEVTEYDKITSNPFDVAIEECAGLAREAGIEAIVAVGGGSAIDACKAVSILMANESPINQYEGINLVKIPGPPVIAIPTTAGTASEVTSFTVVADSTRRKKMVIGGQNVGARFALIDPLLTLSMPPLLTAETGMGAFSHAVEAYLSVAASVATDINALKAIELLAGNIARAVEKGDDVDIRTSVMLGSMLAGFAYNSAILGLAHSISHPLTFHCGLSHGVGNAAVLPHVMRFNSSSVAEKIRNIGLAMGLAVRESSPSEAVDLTICAIADLSRRIGIPNLKEAGVSRESFEAIASDALMEISTIFNPRNPKKEDVIHILENAYQ